MPLLLTGLVLPSYSDDRTFNNLIRYVWHKKIKGKTLKEKEKFEQELKEFVKSFQAHISTKNGQWTVTKEVVEIPPISVV